MVQDYGFKITDLGLMTGTLSLRIKLAVKEY